MEQLNIEPTHNTPGVIMNHREHYIGFYNESRPENPLAFFSPLLKWLDDYKSYVYYMSCNQTKKITITCSLKLNYFNSSSAKYLIEVIIRLQKIKTENKNCQLMVNWYYDKDDDATKETGAFVKEMLKEEINIIEV